MSESEVGVITLVAGIQVDGEWKAVSQATDILVLTAFTEEEAVAITEKTSEIEQEIQKLQEENKTKEEIKQIVLESLSTSEDVSGAGVSESGNIVWYALKSGALGAVTLSSEDNSSQVMTANMVSMAALDMQVLSNKISTTSVGNQRVVIFSAHGQTDGNELATKLKESTVSFTVNHFSNEDANVEEFKKMFEYGTIVFDTLGASLFKGDFTKDFPYLSKLFSKDEEQVIILTGEKVSAEKTKKYNADLKTGRLVSVDGYYAITPAFIEHYGKQNGLPKSLVYANSPYSFANKTLANQFIKNDALAYVGFEELVQPGMMLDGFEALLSEGTTLENALDTEKYVGNGSLSYIKAADLANGDLAGTTGWISGGHFESITQLGMNVNEDWTTIKPTQGDSMGIISSGVDGTALDGRQSWVYQTFNVPEDMNTLKFDYNVVSNEPMVFIGSGFDDTFKATIIEGPVKEPQEGDADGMYNSNPSNIYDVPWLQSTIDENETMIVYESINSSNWGQDYDDDRQRVDVEFPSGDQTTYMTGWKTLTYDVTKYQGKTITLKLQTWDLGDTAYPTAALFDNVRLAKSEVQGLTIDGVEEAFIPHDVEREYQFNAFDLDQFGEKITSEISLRLDNRGYRQPVYKQQGTFSLKQSVEGINIDPQTGRLTISSEAELGEVTIVATGAKGVAEHTVQVKELTKEVNKVSQVVANEALGLTATSVSSESDGPVVTASVIDEGVLLSPKAPGTATITVTDAEGNTATIKVEVFAEGKGLVIATAITGYVDPVATSDFTSVKVNTTEDTVTLTFAENVTIATGDVAEIKVGGTVATPDSVEINDDDKLEIKLAEGTLTSNDNVISIVVNRVDDTQEAYAIRFDSDQNEWIVEKAKEEAEE